MAHAIAVAAEEVNDHDDDEYQSERHGTLPRWAAGGWESATPPGKKSTSRPLVPAKEPGMWLSRHSGMVQRTRPGISRFRVRCFASPRNDGAGLFRLQLQRGRIDAVAQAGRAG